MSYSDSLTLSSLEKDPETPLSGIASFSKVLAIKDPLKYAIYDARVAVSINAIQMISKVLTLITFSLLLSLNFSYADNHDTETNIIDKAKEINQKVKEKQALQNSPSNSEEPLPLNDPFVGDGSLGGGSGVKIIGDSEEDKKRLSVFNYKLLGIIEGDQQMFASLVNEDGNIINVGFFEELAPGVRLVGLNSKEVIFERDEGSLVVINFKNQIIERKN